MRTRNARIHVRLNEKELERFNRRVKKSGLTREAYLRQLLSDLVPTDQPPPDYFNMMRRLNSIGNNLNQIALKAHVLNYIDAKQYEENVSALDRAIIEITNAVMLPRKVECKGRKMG